jgi:hypothetical protein
MSKIEMWFGIECICTIFHPGGFNRRWKWLFRSRYALQISIKAQGITKHIIKHITAIHVWEFVPKCIVVVNDNNDFLSHCK